MDNKNLIKNVLLGTISFGLGSLTMYKLVELSLADYMHKKDKSSSTNKYKDNNIIMEYYDHWKNNK